MSDKSALKQLKAYILEGDGGMINNKHLHIDEVELFYEPREAALGMMPKVLNEPEMTNFESAFLCGMIKKNKPRNIVEVGIAGGGTSAIILECIDMLDMHETRVHSVDFSESFYRDYSKKSGYLAEYILNEKPELRRNHFYHLGNIAVSFIEEIGEIDFLILDTRHVMPGEILDFITLLPYMKNGGVILLHDIIMNHDKDKLAFATNVLFSTSVGEKYINTDNSRRANQPNIGAIIVGSETKDYMENVFRSLLLTWKYVPENNQMGLYDEAIRSNYSHDLYNIFIEAWDLNKKSSQDMKDMRTYFFPYHLIERKSKVIIYGGGKVGRAYREQIRQNQYCEVIKWIDDNYLTLNNSELSAVESIRDTNFDKVLIAVNDENEIKQIQSKLKKIGVRRKKIVFDKTLCENS